MSHTTTDSERPVADVVEALLGSDHESAEPCDLEAQAARVVDEVDAQTAEAHCRSLLAHLADDPQSVRELEALIVLGLAHPDVLDAHRIPLAQEGRRLAHLLERDGHAEHAQQLLELIASRSPEDRQIDHELASMMRRTGNADRLVERYLRRAEECVASDRTKEAISWLQEVLLIDRSRRDVARMIRDLRWGDQEKRLRWRTRLRTSAIVLVLVTAVLLVVQRERDVAARFAAVPAAIGGDLASLRQRAEQLDRLQEENPFSVRLFEAARERARLQVEITQLEAKSAQQQLARRSQRESELAIAESARKQGRILAQQDRYPEALEQFERALASGPGDWNMRAQITRDIAAIREWIATHGSNGQGSTR